jgi:hypothetical protein
VIFDSSIQSLIRQTVMVDQRNGHVRS